MATGLTVVGSRPVADSWEGGLPSGGPRSKASSPSGRPWTLAGLMLAVLGLAMFPLGGLVGVVCGSIGYSRGDRRLGVVAVIASAISFCASFYVAYLVLEG
jgi:hypothetical protein